MNSILKSIFQYAFVATLLWLGFVAAISFMEAPLRFQAEEVPQVHALRIGHLVFHGLNSVELVLGSVTLLGLLAGGWNRSCRISSLLLLLVLTVQTWLLFTVLDERTLAKIAGQELEPAIWHSAYIGLELLKAILLVILAFFQIRQFRDHLQRPAK